MECRYSVAGEILRECLVMERVNLSRVQDLLRKDPGAVLVPSYKGRTALHTAIERHSDFPTILRLLLHADDVTRQIHCLRGHDYSSVIHVRDLDRLSPIDTVTRTIVNQEERLRFFRDPSDESDEGSEQLKVERQWECARLLVIHYAQDYRRNRNNDCASSGSALLPTNIEDLPTLHAFCAAPGLPPSLLELALRRFHDHLFLEDEHGNLPLHYIAMLAPDKGDDDFLPAILKAAPTSVSHANHQGQLPFHVAVAAGRHWSTGCASLLYALPDALSVADAASFQVLLLAFLEQDSIFAESASYRSLLYCLLRNHSAIVAPTLVTSSKK
jgi:ankyrin repeat protein